MGQVKAMILRKWVWIYPYTMEDVPEMGKQPTWPDADKKRVRAEVHLSGAAALKSADFFSEQVGGREVYLAWLDNRQYEPRPVDRIIYRDTTFDVFRVVHQDEVTQCFIKEVFVEEGS